MMRDTAQRYEFRENTDVNDIRTALLVALWSTESLHGKPAVQLETTYHFNPDTLVCEIEDTTQIGQDLNRIFLGFLHRELSTDAFTTERVAEEDRGNLYEETISGESS